MWLRQVPHSAFCCWLVPLAETTTCLPPSTFAEISGWSVTECLPAGPSAETVCPDTVTFTFSGTSIGFLPSRDITLPDLADEFPAHALLARLAVAQDALRSGQHLNAQAVHDAPQAVHAPEDPAAGLRHPLDLRDHGRPVGAILQVQVERLALLLLLVVDDLHVLEVALGPEHLRHALLQDRVGQADALVAP